MKKFEQDYKYLYKQKVEECERLRRILQLVCDDLGLDFKLYKDITSTQLKVICHNRQCLSDKNFSKIDKYINQAKKEMEE